MKKGPAVIAAFVTVLALIAVVGVIGINALFNPSSVVAGKAPDTAGNVDLTTLSTDQMGSLISQYQAREQQYQQQLDQVQQALTQTSSDLQQYQALVQQLQAAGVLEFRDGQVFLHRGGFGRFGDDD